MSGIHYWKFSTAADTTITDSTVRAPPTTGTYNYNAFTPPAKGSSYVDPIFGKSVRRLTDIGANAWPGDNYSFHYVNCDGTKSFSRGAGTFDVISTTDGSTLYSSQPAGLAEYECRWSMTDPDKYYYWSGANLTRRNLTAQTNTTIKTFPFTLVSQGGTGNYQDATDRYFCVSWNNGGIRTYVWDSQTDTTSPTGVANFAAGGGWIAISPNAAYLITAAGTTNPVPNIDQEHYSYTITAGTMALGAAKQYWGMGGDHSQAISCSDGKTYIIGFDNYNVPSVNRIDVSLDQTGRTYAQQIADSLLLLTFQWEDGAHFSTVSTGSLKDWVIYSGFRYNTPNADQFNFGASPWYAFEAEVVAINVLTGAKRRLCHHRSRAEVGGGYTYSCSPRASISADGSFLVFASNMNDSTPTGYADLYGIANPLTSL